MTYEEKSAIVISQLRADRDRLLDVLDNIRAEIEFEVDHRTNMLCAEDVFDIIDKYRQDISH